MRAGTKKAQVIRMLQRSNGASVAEITRVIQWQPHSVRGFISRALVHDLGLKVTRFKRDLSPRESITSPTREELGQVAAQWPTSRLVRLWNGLPGVTPVKRFTDRKTALNGIWKALANGSAKSTTRAKGSRQSRALGETHDALKIPARRAECSLTENVRSPFHAEPGK